MFNPIPQHQHLNTKRLWALSIIVICISPQLPGPHLIRDSLAKRLATTVIDNMGEITYEI